MTMTMPTRSRRLTAEFVGTGMLLATVVGSGIMAERLAGGNVALALLGNTIATGAILYVLITMFAAVSGAHFNPAVTLVFTIRRDLPPGDGLLYVIAQVAGGLVGMLAAHLMFDETLLQISTRARTGLGQWTAEAIATFGLVAAILCTIKIRADAVAAVVGLYITAAYWFTASTSFANPAVTIARSFSNTFSGISPQHMPAFVFAQFVGALAAMALCSWLLIYADTKPKRGNG